MTNLFSIHPSIQWYIPLTWHSCSCSSYIPFIITPSLVHQLSCSRKHILNLFFTSQIQFLSSRFFVFSSPPSPTVTVSMSLVSGFWAPASIQSGNPGGHVTLEISLERSDWDDGHASSSVTPASSQTMWTWVQKESRWRLRAVTSHHLRTLNERRDPLSAFKHKATDSSSDLHQENLEQQVEEEIHL